MKRPVTRIVLSWITNTDVCSVVTIRRLRRKNARQVFHHYRIPATSPTLQRLEALQFNDDIRVNAYPNVYPQIAYSRKR